MPIYKLLNIGIVGTILNSPRVARCGTHLREQLWYCIVSSNQQAAQDVLHGENYELFATGRFFLLPMNVDAFSP